MREHDFRLHVMVVGWLHVFESILYIGAAILIMGFFIGIGMVAEDPKALSILSIIGLCGAGFLLLFGVPILLAGWGLLKHKRWSRVLALVLAILGLFLFPIGTIVGIYVIWVLTSEPAAKYFADTTWGEAPASPAT